MKYILQVREFYSEKWSRSAWDADYPSLEEKLKMANRRGIYRVIDELGNVVTEIPEEPKTAGTRKYMAVALTINKKMYDTPEEAREEALSRLGVGVKRSGPICVVELVTAHKQRAVTTVEKLDITKEFTGG